MFAHSVVIAPAVVTMVTITATVVEPAQSTRNHHCKQGGQSASGDSMHYRAKYLTIVDIEWIIY